MIKELDIKDITREDLIEELIEKVVSKNKYVKSGYVHIPVWLIGLSLPLLTAIVISYGAISSRQTEMKTELTRGTKDIENLYKTKTNDDKSDLILKRLDDVNTNLIRIEGKIDSHLIQTK